VAAAFWPFVLRFEAREGLQRGKPGSERAAMVFGQYFPNPAFFGTAAAAQALVSPLLATLVEGFGTAVLVFVIFALTDPDNRASPGANLAPFFNGFTVAVLIALFAPITQAGWNPARDLGPRLVALALGWGKIALPSPRWGSLVYLVGPLAGGPLGGWLYTGLLGSRPPAQIPSARLPAQARGGLLVAAGADTHPDTRRRTPRPAAR
jgi:glycerol uptake facilitator protein